MIYDRDGIPTIDPRDAESARRGEANGYPRPLLVDVREVSEIEALRATEVVVLPLSQFGIRYRELPADRPLYVICQSGSRSAAATAHLLRNGYSEVANVAGGTIAWTRAGLPVRQGPLMPGEGRIS